jgi:peptide/nickel transport system permease protein
MKRLKQLRLNVPLVLGGILLVALLVVLVMPSVVDMPGAFKPRTTAEIEGKIVVPPYKPGQLGLLLGSDKQGFDVFAEVIYAARPTVAFVLIVTLARTLLSVPLGLWAGWRRGWAAKAVEGLATGIGSLPVLLLAIYATATVQTILGDEGRRWIWPALILVAVGVPRLAEQVRRLTEEMAVRPHIEAAVAAGASGWRIVWRHIYPLMRGDLLVTMTAEVGWVLLMVGQVAVFHVAFSGPIVRLPGEMAGSQMWGTMMAFARDDLRTYPWIPYPPAVALGLTIMAFHLFAEGIRQRWVRR